MNVFSGLHRYDLMINQNKYDIRNQHEKLHLSIYVLAKNFSHPKLICTPPQIYFKEIFPPGPPQVNFGQKRFFTKTYIDRCSFSCWFRISYLFWFIIGSYQCKPLKMFIFYWKITKNHEKFEGVSPFLHQLAIFFSNIFLPFCRE